MTAKVTCRVFDVQRFSVHDGPGVRTTIFLEGCALRCAWCQNPEAFLGRRSVARTPEALIDEALRDRAFYGDDGGVTLSGGEPLLHLPPALALLQEAKRHGLHTCVQTSGAVPWAHLEAVAPLVDLFQFDLKHLDPARHRALTGVDPARLHENAARLVELGANVQFRMPVVPGVNDDDDQLGQLADFLALRGAGAIRLVPYHRLYLQKYTELGLPPPRSDLQPPSAATLARVTDRLARRALTVTVDA